MAAGGDSGTYTLYLTEVQSDDYSASTATSGTVTVGDSVSGEVEAEGDEDWVAVALEAGKTYRFDLKGARTRDGTLYDPHLLGIHDADGDILDGTTDDDSGLGLNSRVTFTPDQTATHYVAVSAGRDWEGSYTLYVEEVANNP